MKVASRINQELLLSQIGQTAKTYLMYDLFWALSVFVGFSLGTLPTALITLSNLLGNNTHSNGGRTRRLPKKTSNSLSSSHLHFGHSIIHRALLSYSRSTPHTSQSVTSSVNATQTTRKSVTSLASALFPSMTAKQDSPNRSSSSMAFTVQFAHFGSTLSAVAIS